MLNRACVVCGREIRSAMNEATSGWAAESDIEEPPHAATIFTSQGNYGSTLWDPAPRDKYTPYLQVTICDKCLTFAASAGRVIKCVPVPVPVKTSSVIWQVDEPPVRE